MEYYDGLFKGTDIITSRGCPFHCVFCASSQFWGHRWRARTARNIVSELELLYKDYHSSLGLDGFYIGDDNFMMDKKRVIDICNLILESGLDLQWGCQARVDSADEELYHLMHKAGCRVLEYGIESGSDRILRNIGKDISTDMIRRARQKAKKAGLKVLGNFMLGLPGDTKQTMRETIEFAEKLDIDYPCFHPTYLYPGTPLAQDSKIDWLSFVIEGELEDPLSYPHPCVPTYSDREEMKKLMKSLHLVQLKKSGLLRLAFKAIRHPRRACNEIKRILSPRY